MRKGLTLIELIFVIVVIGILSAIALPKFSDSGTTARIASGRADVMAIRSAILSERQKRLIKGDASYITPQNLDQNSTTKLFGGVLTYPKKNLSSEGHWSLDNNTHGKYIYTVDGESVKFEYNSTTGSFTCDGVTQDTTKASNYCSKLID